MKTRKQTNVDKYYLQQNRFWSAVHDVIEGRTKRVELNAEFLNGAKFIIIAYRLNEQIPVRVDFKIKK